MREETGGRDRASGYSEGFCEEVAPCKRLPICYNEAMAAAARETEALEYGSEGGCLPFPA